MRVDIYWNLHRHKWSIRHKGKVVGHADNVVCADCKFVVGRAGRARVLREGRKNVHAFVRGRLIGTDVKWLKVEENLPEWQAVRYNPYKWGTFVTGADQPVYASKYVVLGQKKLFGLGCI